MSQPFVGSQSVTSGRLTRGALRWGYRAVLPNIYLDKNTNVTLADRAVATWLWTDREGVIAGRAAAAMHGARWVSARTPIEVISWPRRPRPEAIIHNERLDDDEIMMIGDLPVTTPMRTAWDLGRHLPRDTAVRHLDALAAATGVTAVDASTLSARYRGARNIRRAAMALDLMDGGSQSPRETWLRLLLIDAGLPRPRTQIEVSDGTSVAFLDMGYDEPMVGLDYEGKHHSTERGQYVYDIGRADLVDGQGWLDIKVVAEHTKAYILYRVREAFRRRGWTPPKST